MFSTILSKKANIEIVEIEFDFVPSDSVSVLEAYVQFATIMYIYAKFGT